MTAGAKVVFTSGDNLDAWMKDVGSEAGGSPSVVDVGATVSVSSPVSPAAPRRRGSTPLVARPG